ncbi:cytochrome P450 [Trichoderma sp. SZMC 28012]
MVASWGWPVTASEWLSTTALTLTTYNVLRIVYNLYFHPLSKIPGPVAWRASRLPFIWSLLRGTIVHDFERLHRQYGPIIRIAPDEVTFAHEDAYKDIFQLRKDHPQFLKDLVWWKTQPGMADSLLSAIDPKHHARIRSLLAPGFTPRALKEQEHILHFYVNLLVERIRERVNETPESGAVIDMVPWFNFTAFDIFGDLGFGESFNCLQDSKYHPWIALLFNSVKAASYVAAARFYPIVERLLMMCIPPSLRKMQRDHYQQIVDKVDRRLNFELERPDIMSHVIRGTERRELPEGTVHTTFMVLTTAGSETTATALSGTLNYLVNNPDKLETLVREIRGTFQQESDIDLDALRKLPYLNAVLNEGLRLCPPVPWILPRRVPEGGDTVCGTWLPGGTPVSIQAYTMNRDPAYFHSATSFVPERWLSDSRTDQESPFFHDRLQVVQPFSDGPRACLGQHLAWAELRLILSKLIWVFDFEVVEDRKMRWEDLRTFLLVEKKPIEVRARLRDSTASVA